MSLGKFICICFVLVPRPRYRCLFKNISLLFLLLPSCHIITIFFIRESIVCIAECTIFIWLSIVCWIYDIVLINQEETTTTKRSLQRKKKKKDRKQKEISWYSMYWCNKFEMTLILYAICPPHTILQFLFIPFYLDDLWFPIHFRLCTTKVD